MQRAKLLLASCTLSIALATTASAQEKLIVLNEGSWQANNGRVTYFENGNIVSNKWFEEKNGYGIGDTPNDIIQVNDTLIAIAVNWSNIVQFIRPDGTAVAATEDIPNNRKMTTDGRYVYVTSYAHECGSETSADGYWQFVKGYVAKIDAATFRVVDAVEVGYEPEGIAYYQGYLFVCNSGGYSFQEGHDYERTVSVIDAETMKVVKTIDTGCVNLYGNMSQTGKYLLISAAGDYYENAPSAIVFDCDKALTDAPCFQILPYAATYNCATTDGQFFVVGSAFSYITYMNETNYLTVNPEVVMQSHGAEGISESLPGTVAEQLSSMSAPYGIYVNPYTGYIYATDAKSYAGAGELLQWTPDGHFVGRWKTYICPGHFLALNPAIGVDINSAQIRPSTTAVSAIYDLSGRRTSERSKGIHIIRTQDGNFRKVLIR